MLVKDMRGYAERWRRRARAADNDREREACLALAAQYDRLAYDRLCAIAAEEIIPMMPAIDPGRQVPAST